MASTVFASMLHKCCELFIDDIIAHNSAASVYEEIEAHLAILDLLFRCLRESNLRLHPEKCKFLVRRVKYLGEIIEGGMVRPDPKKLSVVERLKKCETVSDVRHTLGILGVHRSYVKDYSKIAEPLTRLLSLAEKEVAENWGEE